ncbi:hypothetical protein C8R47DRAFT_729914 [Mycena vitilis]|nr:hypothetical protein C8R47DRAFT_729914 [Mycena vitilis]
MFPHPNMHVPWQIIQEMEAKKAVEIGKSVIGVPEVPLEFFFTAVLPPGAESIPSVEEELVEDGLLVDGLWALTSSGSDASADVKEPDYFAALVQIFDAVVEAAEKVLKRPPNARLLRSVSDVVAATRSPLPDAQIRLITPGSDSSSCFATAVPWRIESMRGRMESNDHELLWSCQDVLRDDPRRRFAFGVTLDEAQMRIWFFSRSEELVSSPFDCMTEVAALIHIFVRLAFATAEEIGYDTTMSRFVDDAGSEQMKIAVAGSVYITKKLLSERAEEVCGRTTRVWEAYREDDPDRTSVAIKDLWTSVDAVQEGSQLSELHDQLRSLADPATPRPPSEYFLTVLDHGFVSTSEGVDDHTLDVITRGQVPRTGLSHHPRKHYRIVFKEVGTPLHRLRTLSDVMRALADATRALWLLYKLGLVHRDISPGNILFINGHGKLTDLEYLQSFKGTQAQSSERCIGTVDYASGEAAAQRYCFVPDTDDVRPPRPPFRFNPLHDLESTYWIGLWTILYHRRESQSINALYNEYFPEHSGGAISDRTLAISGGKGPRGGLAQPDPLSAARCTLELLRRRLYQFYQAFEGDLANQCLLFDDEVPVNGSVFDTVHSTFITEYEKAAAESDGIPLTAPELPKRKASGDAGSVSPENPVASPASPERPAKKLKSTSPKGPPPTATRSSGSRKRRSPTQPSRRSARIAGKSKSSGKRTNPT